MLTVRDMATLLPAEWQETVKHRNARGWEDWLGDVIDRESVRCRPAPVVVLARARHAGDPRHLVPAACPPEQRARDHHARRAGSASGLLWQRFASLLGVDPGSVDLTRARPNASLGMPEIEFLRRLNQALPDEVPDWFYMWNVKEAVAHRALAARPRERAAGAAAGAGRPGPRARRRSSSPGWATPGTTSSAIWTSSARRPSPGPAPARRPARRAGARRRGDGGGGAGGQPVPQGVPGGQAAAGPRPAARAGRPGRVDRRVLAAAQADRARAQQPRPRPCAGCASWPGGRSSAAGPAEHS